MNNEAFFTPVELPAAAVNLSPQSHVLLMGSCFAQHVGESLMHQMGEDHVCVNPFGVLYNPLSIEKALRMLMCREKVDAYLFEGRDGKWHSWMHSTHYSGSDRNECRLKAEESMAAAAAMLAEADMLVVTFGTTRCYRLTDGVQEGRVVANCHKELSTLFEEYEPGLDELAVAWTQLLQELRRFNPKLQVVFTVSPYRYRKYGMHQSQLQKAKLLMLVDRLEAEEGSVHYFPAYEIVLDELRDYRFYKPDMLHPSDQTTEIIAGRFAEWTFTGEMHKAAEENLKKWRRAQHRSLY